MKEREFSKLLRSLLCKLGKHAFITIGEWQWKEKPFWDNVPPEAMNARYFEALDNSLNKIGSCKFCGRRE